MREKILDLAQKAGASGRQLQTSGRSTEDRHAEGLLDALHMPAKRRLRDPDTSGRSRQATLFCHDFKITQLPQRHFRVHDLSSPELSIVSTHVSAALILYATLGRNSCPIRRLREYTTAAQPLSLGRYAR